jgi:Polysaccharide lyase family 4, domain II
VLKKKHIFVLLLSLLGLFANAYNARANAASDGQDIRLEIVNGDTLTVAPGRISTIVYKISSSASRDREFQPHMELPEGWRLASPLTPIHVPAGGATIRFITFRVPSSARADSYHALFGVEDSSSPQSIASVNSLVIVEEVFSLDLTIEKLPDYIPAGRELISRLTIRNDGNSTVSVNLEANSSSGNAPWLDQSVFLIAPQDEVSVRARIRTDDQLLHKMVQQAYFRASISGHPEIVRSVTTSVNVVPIYTQIRPKAASMPLQVALQTAGDETGSIGQLSISGSMEALGGQISVDMTLAKQQRVPMFGDRDEYRLTYKSEKLIVNLGDHVQNLSPLTTRGEYGIGVSTVVKKNNVSYTGVFQRTRHVFPEQNLVGASVALTPAASTRLSANLLHRSGLYRGTLATARAEVQPFGRRNQVDVECGLDSGSGFNDPSCRAEIRGATGTLGYQGLLQKTSDSYPGSYSSLRERSATLSWNAMRGIRMDGTARLQKRGFGPGFGRSSEYYRVGVGYNTRFRRVTAFTNLRYSREVLSHSTESFSVDRTENIVQVTSGIQMRRMSLRALVDLGTAKSDANGYQGSFTRTRASIRANILNSVTLTATGEHGSGYLVNTSRPMERWLYSGGINIRLKSSTRINATVYRNVSHSFSRQGYTSFQTFIQHKFRSGHIFTIQAQQSRIDGPGRTPSTDYRLSYSVPLGIPIGHKRSAITYLRGRVYDADTDRGLEGILIFLDDNASITDENGFYSVPRSVDVTQYLRVDQKSIGYDRVPLLGMPFVLHPSADMQTLDIPIVRAGAVSGTITLKGSPDRAPMLGGKRSPAMSSITALRNVVVELADDANRHRSRTDRSGKFEIKNVPPGRYTLRIVASRLPDYYRFEEDSVNVILEAGKAITRDFIALPITRTIRMLTNKATGKPLRLGGGSSSESDLRDKPSIPETMTRKRSVELNPDHVSPPGNTHRPKRRELKWFDLLIRSGVESESSRGSLSVIPPRMADLRESIPDVEDSSADSRILLGIVATLFILLIAAAGLIRYRRNSRMHDGLRIVTFHRDPDPTPTSGRPPVDPTPSGENRLGTPRRAA